jgi:hypothetical protein
MTDVREVGPYVVRALNVREGLKLLADAADGAGGMLQMDLLLACTTKDGKPIDDGSFGELLPHMPKLVEAAVALNGFQVQA